MVFFQFFLPDFEICPTNHLATISIIMPIKSHNGTAYTPTCLPGYCVEPTYIHKRTEKVLIDYNCNIFIFQYLHDANKDTTRHVLPKQGVKVLAGSLDCLTPQGTFKQTIKVVK